jgi:hypothetical protein
MDRMTPAKILLQTTISTTADDWSIARFSRLAALLDQARGVNGERLFEVTARDRDPCGAPDSLLSTLEHSGYDELWLFAVDAGDGLSEAECEAVSRFRRKGGGLLVTRDHMDLGCSVCGLAGVGKAHFFHSRNLDPAVENRVIDDPFTRQISWPNYHSGANGDFQAVEAALPLHPVLEDPDVLEGRVRFLPAHPHEGAVAAPKDEDARVIALGRSKVTGRRFNLAVAFEAGPGGGRAIAQSTFHHFADYNWDIAAGCPSFVDEPPGGAMAAHPEALAATHRYVLNVAAWLAKRAPPRA